jgi:hypothetical protein
MPVQNIRDSLLLSLVLRYEQDCDQFVTLSKQTVDSSSARLVISGLRNEGLVEEQVRGVIRLTALGYKKYRNKPPSAYAGYSAIVPREQNTDGLFSAFGSYTCLSNLA